MSSEYARMPFAELQKTREFEKLTPKQQLWVATYCESGQFDGKYDPISATMTAYECRCRENARIYSYQILKMPKIIAVLNVHFMRSPTEQFLSDLDKAIDDKRLTPAQVQALRMKAQLLGIMNKNGSFRRKKSGPMVPSRPEAPEKYDPYGYF